MYKRREWWGKLDSGARLVAEKIAVRYHMQWQAGMLDDSMFKSVYCDGMIEAVALMEGVDVSEVQEAVAGYCAAHGYMPNSDERPIWMDWQIKEWQRRWADEDEPSKKDGCVESRSKLVKHLQSLGFTVTAGPTPKKQWVLLQDGVVKAYMEVTAHRDGRMADYILCNSSWYPLTA